jgi:hypothetical protein
MKAEGGAGFEIRRPLGDLRGEALRKSNRALCAEYNEFKAAHKITTDDPNVFNEKLLEDASEDLKEWFSVLNSARAKETLLQSKAAGTR